MNPKTKAAPATRKFNPATSFTPEQVAAADAARNQASSRTPEEVLRSFLPSTQKPLPPVQEIVDLVFSRVDSHNPPRPHPACELDIQTVPFSTFLILQASGNPLVEGGTGDMLDIPRALLLIFLARDHEALAASLAFDKNNVLSQAAGECCRRLDTPNMMRLGLAMHAALRGEFGAAVPTGKVSKKGEDSAPLAQTATALS